MVLTEPDAGSDLQASRSAPSRTGPATGSSSGVKRFITNGCGEVLLVLARSEPEIADGRGLSLFLVRARAARAGPPPRGQARHPRQPDLRALLRRRPGASSSASASAASITYVMSLMNGARIGIAAQALGIGEAAYRVARDYAAQAASSSAPRSRTFPAVRELLVDMSVDLQAARALTYYASFCVDLETGASRRLEGGGRRGRGQGPAAGAAPAQARQRDAHADEQVLRLARCPCGSPTAPSPSSAAAAT